MTPAERHLARDFLDFHKWVSGQVGFFKDLYLYYLKRNGKLADLIKQTAWDLKKWGNNGRVYTKKYQDPHVSIKWGRNRV